MQHTMWTSDPTHQVLSLITAPPFALFVISTRTFFKLEGMATVIPWKHWGLSNTHVFEWQDLDCNFMISISGSRVLKAFPTAHMMDSNDDLPVEYRLHSMMDFSPLAVVHQKSLGRVVREPSTIDLDGQLVTSSLPCVEVVSSTKSTTSDDTTFFWMDDDRIYVLHESLEVIKISESAC
ncbi:uncharacterized protein F5147DRAFT_684277 [Suillus discolor]|uniref:Uncharacterized protein n=1 Tax=Suillus discolor TaxID=1912936 RepID=A0A9P7FC69_9AGAM|nr:uncharacterized protein F5147DRAFT_684277 [Suillus discolor]KAG2112209.1 hypothetical protein F5147DRAFT_684277 [Suillus discolor]